MTKDMFESELNYIRKQHYEELSVLVAEHDFWKAKYDEILKLLSNQDALQPNKIYITLSDDKMKSLISDTGGDV